MCGSLQFDAPSYRGILDLLPTHPPKCLAPSATLAYEDVGNGFLRYIHPDSCERGEASAYSCSLSLRGFAQR